MAYLNPKNEAKNGLRPLRVKCFLFFLPKLEDIFRGTLD